MVQTLQRGCFKTWCSTITHSSTTPLEVEALDVLPMLGHQLGDRLPCVGRFSDLPAVAGTRDRRFPQPLRRRIRMRILKILTISAVFAFSIAGLSNHSATASRVVSAAADGPALFNNKCALCHDKNGAGKANWRAKGQPDLRDPNWQKGRTDAQISDSIRNGMGKLMPAFKGKLSDEEVSSVVAYIRRLKKK
jgi:cytochrome c553